MQAKQEKFTSTVNAEILATVRQIASEEGRSFQSALDEAMHDFVQKKRGEKPRKHVMTSLVESIDDFDELYQKLAKS